MSSDAARRVTGLSHGSITERGELVRVSFTTQDGGSIRLEWDAATFASGMASLNEMLAHLTMAAHAGTEKLELCALRIRAYSARATDRSNVVLSVRTENNQLQHFSSSPEQTEELLGQLARAIETTRERHGGT